MSHCSPFAHGGVTKCASQLNYRFCSKQMINSVRIKYHDESWQSLTALQTIMYISIIKHNTGDTILWQTNHGPCFE